MTSVTETAPLGGSDRAERIRRIADECLKRWAVGESFSETELIEANPDLQPELGIALRRIRQIAQAEQDGSDDDPTPRSPKETVVHEGFVPSSGCMHIRCPHCHNPVELLVDSPLTDITCSTCGSAFSLVSSDNQTCQAPPLQSLGHFELVSRLGMGGFGTVWKAHDLELDRTVAVKIPRRGQLDPIGEEQFLREARVAAQLRHPNIVCIHEVGREGETLYIVSDFVRGVSLSEWLTAKKPSARESAELMIKIARALHYAHEKGVVHRDLKPSNVMIDREGEPHLLDFGLAKRDAGELTMTADGQVLGTPAYMSPEQGEGESHYVDRRADVYSFGVILFELLTGELPFRGIAQMQIHQKLTEDAPSPRKLNQFVPRDMATICSKCLERDPNRRYPSARELANDLDRFVKGEPIHARPVSRTEKSLRWIKRYPWVATAAGLIVFLAVAGPIVAWRIYTEKQLQARFLRERNNAYDQMKVERDEAIANISSLRETVAAYQGRVNPWQLWPPRRANGPRQNLMSSLLRPQLTTLEERLDTTDLDEEQALHLELTVAIIRDESGDTEQAIKHYGNCIDRLQRLLASAPQRKELLLALADCYNQLGRLQMPRGQGGFQSSKESQERLEQARTAYEQIADDRRDPQVLAEVMIGEVYASALAGDKAADQPMSRFMEIKRTLETNLPQDPTKLYELASLIAERWPYLTFETRVEEED